MLQYADAGPNHGDNDDFVWRLNMDGNFSVASVAEARAEFKDTSWLPQTINKLKVLRKMELPPKIKILAWRKFIDRIPTKDLLIITGVLNIPSNPLCEFCNNCLESSIHLFSTCHVSKGI